MSGKTLALLARLGARLVLGLLVVAAHGLVGSWLARQDALDALISQSWMVGAALVLLVPLRLCTWLLVPAWLVAGTTADLWDAWSRRHADVSK